MTSTALWSVWEAEGEEQDRMRPPGPQPGDIWSFLEMGALVIGAQLDTQNQYSPWSWVSTSPLLWMNSEQLTASENKQA